MGLFSNQLLNVIEWNETRNDVLFWKWHNDEIKKNSRLIIRPGQDAIFLYNGRIEGIFEDEGNYQLETDIIPFLSTLKGFKFGFVSGLKAEVLFINTKEFQVKWGTKNPINIKAQSMPGGIPIRAFGTFTVKISDHIVLIDKIAGIKRQFTVEDVKERALTVLDQLIMKWIAREGKDLFNLQSNSFEIARGIKRDLDMEMIKIGLTVTNLNIENFNYPESVQKMVEKNAAYGMVGNVGHYQNVAMAESMEKNSSNMAASMAQAGMGIQMGMNMMNEMSKSMNSNNTKSNEMLNNNKIKCSSCGFIIDKDSKFCSECGFKGISKPEVKDKVKFCSECGSKLQEGVKFCSECGTKVS